jgi:hypothetical protein
MVAWPVARMAEWQTGRQPQSTGTAAKTWCRVDRDWWNWWIWVNLVDLVDWGESGDATGFSET